MLLHTESVILESLTCVFSKTRATHVSRVRKNFTNNQVACAALQLSVCVYVLTEISMDTLSQYACVRPTLLDVLCIRTQQCWTTLGWPRNKGNVGRLFWAVSMFTQQHPTTSSKSQQRWTGWTNALNMFTEQFWVFVQWTCLVRLHAALYPTLQFLSFVKSLIWRNHYTGPCGARLWNRASLRDHKRGNKMAVSRSSL